VGGNVGVEGNLVIKHVVGNVVVLGTLMMCNLQEEVEGEEEVEFQKASHCLFEEEFQKASHCLFEEEFQKASHFPFGEVEFQKPIPYLRFQNGNV
jgi:hypothetical protein